MAARVDVEDALDGLILSRSGMAVTVAGVFEPEGGRLVVAMDGSVTADDLRAMADVLDAHDPQHGLLARLYRWLGGK